MEQKPHLKKDEYRLIMVRHDSFIEFVKPDVFDDLFNKIDKAIEGADDFFYNLSDHAGVVSANTGEEKKEYRETFRRIKLHFALAMLTSLYHQWEKDIRKCMGSSSENGYNNSRKLIGKLPSKFKEFGWDIEKETCYQTIKICGLIVNIYKHKEFKLDKLDQEHPKFFKKEPVCYPHGDEDFGGEVWEEELSMKEDGFYEIAGAFKQFWEKFWQKFPEEHR